MLYPRNIPGESYQILIGLEDCENNLCLEEIPNNKCHFAMVALESRAPKMLERTKLEEA